MVNDTPIPPRRSPDWAVLGAVAAGVAALLLVAVIVVVTLRSGNGTDAPRSSGATSSAPAYAPPAPLPTLAVTPRPGAAGGADAQWVQDAASATGIPERALAAYAGAALFKAADRPGCGLSWNTLAGIGLAESNHGRYAGSAVGADGTVSPPIFGIALDGSSSAHIPDSDGGAIDGDVAYDRAVGPMQIIPVTWRNWHVDGNGDGLQDPHNIDDAVIAAANYLCRASPDMVDPDGWRAGLFAYNRSDAYARTVADAAVQYAEAVAR
jgi:membrane-bound lytic murein transglycosylase B